MDMRLRQEDVELEDHLRRYWHLLDIKLTPAIEVPDKIGYNSLRFIVINGHVPKLYLWFAASRRW